ncbi:phosphotransferase [bacterium]|nr:phosphotransferase [bacterium]
MFDHQRLTEICERFGIDPAGLRFISHSQNAVYSYDGAAGRAVLRVSVDRGRTLAQIEAELLWIRDLAERGCQVCQPRRSLHGRWCEHMAFEDGNCYAVLFDHAPGRQLELSDLDAGFYQNLGRLTARLHAASFDVAPPEITLRDRPRWYESRLLTTDIERYCPTTATPFKGAVASLIAELRPSVEQELGIIHGDLSLSNIHRDGDQLWLFDFDNCEIGCIWQDFAVILYDSIYCRLLHRVQDDQLADRCQELSMAFLQGYQSLRPLKEFSSELLRGFLILREAVIYTHYCRILDPATLTNAFRAGMDEMRRHVETGSTSLPAMVFSGIIVQTRE